MKTIAKRIIGLVLALAIVAGLVPVTGVLDIEAQAATVNYAPMPNYIQDGVTLHCWNWSIANIRANLGLIANSGYSAIQLSPMQELKETSVNKPYDNWWVVYQPISFNLNTKADHAVGTKSELIELCKEAHKYGLKVIMDVVCNHTANGGAANTLCPQVDPDILNDPNCWHDYRTNSWDYSDRYNITQYCMAGLPDLNTGNKKVQQKALDMLKEYIDCGVDGFRWDAAKQIETPNDVYCSSDFWPTVINGANSYASSTRGIYLYHYGELLENADTRNSLHMSAYTQYMSVTESVWSNDVRYKLEDHNAWGLRKEYFKETSADKMVLWAESHDTFGDKSSIYTSQYNLDKAWSLVTSRAYTMALFFPRANDMLYQEMGELAKVSWTSKLTTEVNKFHNHFAGQSECLTQAGNSNLYYNERGNSGIIITNFNDGGRDINIPVYAMANGTYYDQITGNQFTVSGGRLYGAMGDTGVAVVYNPGTKSCSHSSHGSDGYCYSCYAYVGHKSGTKCSTCGAASTRTIYFNNTAGWSTPYIYGWHDNGGAGTAGWPGVKMTKVEGTIYKATIPTTATNVIFHNNNGTQTANITPSAKADIYHYNTGFWSSSTGEGEPELDYYLFGWINGADYGTGDDYANLGQYKFENGMLITSFAKDSYIGIKTNDNTWYMTQGDATGTSAKFYNTTAGGDGKMLVPGGVQLTFTLKKNLDGTLTLSYSTKVCNHSYTSKVTTAAGCTTTGVRTYTCSSCGYSYKETIAAAGHKMSGTVCTVCGYDTACSHNYSSVTNRQPTCTSTGLKTYTCSKCGDSYTQVLSAVAHKYSGGKCSVCGTMDSAYNPDYYLFGYINGANYGCEGDHQTLGQYKFVNGKLTATFTSDSYVAVKTSDNANWYMTNGWLGESTSAVLYNSEINTDPNKLFVPGGVSVTFTLVNNGDDSLTLSYVAQSCSHSYSASVTRQPTCTVNGVKTYTCTKCSASYTESIPTVSHNYSAGKCTVCGAVDMAYSVDYYLFGYINGADYGTGNDYANLGQYKFVNGQLTATFNTDSYVGVKTSDNAGWYMTNGWQGTDATSAVLYNADVNANPDKLYVPGGVSVTFTLVNNGNDTLTLSYTTGGRTPESCSHSYTSRVTAATCTTGGYITYICSKCNDYYTETLPATGHSFVGGQCSNCGQQGSNEYYLFGYINGADCGVGADHNNLGAYKFVDGKVTVTFTSDSYVAVKTSDNANWYMTNGWLGEVSSATLYKFTDPYTVSANKLMVSGGQTVTFTLTENWDGNLVLSYTAQTGTCNHVNHNQSGLCVACGASVEHSFSSGICTGCGLEDASFDAFDYYLFGYINGANYGCEDDYANLGEYKFADGKLTVCFNQDSYVGVKKTYPNGKFGVEVMGWYMTEGWQGTDATSVTLINGNQNTNPDKLYVPGGVEVTFTVEANSDGTLTLSYAIAEGSDEYYLFGYINGADCGVGEDHNGLGSYKFVDGKVTVTFTDDSYVAVKTGDNRSWYMTNGWQGEVSSAILYKFTDPYSVSANKLMVSGGQTVTFTLTENWDGNLILSYTVEAGTCNHASHNQNGACTLCGAAVEHSFSNGLCTVCGVIDENFDAFDYYLFGYINGANYGCEDDYANLGQYKFAEGKLTVTFDQDSYVGVKKTYPNGKFGVEVMGWYMTEGWQGTDATSVTLINANQNTNPDKLYVPGGVEVTFTLVNNGDGSLTLSYTTGGRTPESCSHSYTSRVTAATCTTGGYITYICSKCNDYYTETLPATGHSFVGGQCSNCGQQGSNEYYLFGYINGADCGIGDDHNNLGAYKFVDGKVTVTFTSDSYVAVKTSDNANWYMTNGWLGEVSSATLYKFTDPYTVSANKLMVSGGQTVTFTLTENWDGNLKLSYTVQADTCNHANHNQSGQCVACGATVEHSFSNGICTGCGLEDGSFEAFDYYLFGYINGANYGCEEDHANLGAYKFENGKLTATFDQDSYVGVKKTYPNGKFGLEVMGWYMTEGFKGIDATSATLVNSNQNVNPDKLYVPGGRTVTFTLEVNDDGTLTLSYEVAACEHLYNAVTSGLSCTTDGTRTYTCGKCGHSYTEAVPALGHNYVGGYCSLCGQSQNSGTQNGDYYLFGYINGADYGIGADHNNLGSYKFVDGKVTVTFTEDSYVAVKTGDNRSFYMTNGWLGAVTSANLYLFTDPYTASANKLMVSGGQTVTFTLTDNGNGTLKLRYTVESGTCSHIRHNQNGQCATCGATVEHTFAHGVCTVCGLMDSGYEAYDYYLFGYINGANYGSEEDWQNLGFFKFRSIGTCSATFTSDSYVGVKKVDPGTGEVVGWYMTNGWQGTDTASATLYNTDTLGGNADKLYAPAGVRLVFTLVNNGDGTLSLSYADVNCNHTFDSGKVTSQAGCGTEGTMTYTCTNCGHYYEETLAAVGHNCVGGKCTRCGAADPNKCCTNHSYSIEYQIQSSCTEAGVRSFRAACGATYTVSLPFSGHSYNSRVETAATCVLPGLKSYTCSCGESYSEPFAALGHQYQDGRCKACGASQSSGEVVDQTYYLFGSINGVDYGCGNDWENLGEYLFVGGQLTATFDTDSYVAVKTGDNANWFMTESYVTSNSATFHSTTTGTYEKMFVPGGVRVTFTLTENADGTLTLSYTTAGAGSSVILPTLTLKYPTMSFKDEVKLNIYYEATDLNNVVDMGLIVFSSQVNSYTVYNAESVVAGYNYNASAGLYTVNTNGIPAKNMGDTIWFAVYAQLSNGTYAYSKLVSYSPRDYAYALLGSGDAKLDALLVAMLNYGAAAQTYFGYRISNLLNSDLTAAQKGLITGYNSSMVTNIAAPGAAKQGAFVKNGGFDDKYPSVSFGGAFAINYYCVPSYTPVSGVTMYYWRDADYNAASVLTPSNATGVVTMTGSGTYKGSVTGISAKDLSDGVYVAFVYSTGSNTYCSGVLQYSIGMYCDTMVSYPNEFTPFAQATAVYGYYAKQYFG